MIESTLQKVFEELGLSNFDLEMYQHVLSSKKLSVTSLSKSMNSSRSKIYNSLHILHQSEIILFQPFSKNKIIPLSPQIILSKLKYKSNQIHNLTTKFELLIPELKGEFGFEGNDYFKIIAGVGNLYRLLHQIIDLIEEDGEYLWFNETNELSYFFRDFFFGEYSKKRTIKNIKARILANPNNIVLKNHIQPNDKELRTFKYLPTNYIESATFTIFGDSIIFWNIELQRAYWINDKTISQTHKSIFESYWNGQP
jgi:sugar-specific transcriptional regulator TrmB